MAKKYLAFLGTNKYLECYYIYQEHAVRCRFVQEALTSIFCCNWTQEDRILVFTTKAAEEINWKTSEGWIGLDECLRRLQLPCSHENIMIPEGDSEESLWNIFEVIFTHIHEQDEIIFDVTHALRSLPVITLIILNYAKFMRNCTLTGMYYGAFETLGPIHKVKEKPVEERRTPVFALTPFVSLLDWTVGIDRFLNTGDASVITMLTQQTLPKILQESPEHVEHTLNLRKVAQAIFAFSQNSAMCRRNQFTDDTLSSPQNIDRAIQASHQILKPLTPLLQKMQERFHTLAPNRDLGNVFLQVRWCADHNLVQQGLTLLFEGVISELCRRLDLPGTSHNERHAISRGLGVLHKDLSKPVIAYTKTKTLSVEALRHCLPKPHQQFLNTFERLRQARNAINHASSRRKAGYFKKALHQSLTELEDLLV